MFSSACLVLVFITKEQIFSDNISPFYYINAFGRPVLDFSAHVVM